MPAPSPIVVVLAISVFFAIIATVFMVIAISTDQWEVIEHNADKIAALSQVLGNSSVLNETTGYFKVVYRENSSGNITTVYTYSLYGGIWKLCDRVPDEHRKYMDESQKEKKRCFNYLSDYTEKNANLFSRDAQWLMRMQNSASACTIVSVIVLFTSGLIGLFGAAFKQVSACMVTGAMYLIAGVFAIFALVIMHSKIRIEQEMCYAIEPVQNLLCSSRTCHVGHSMMITWSAVAFCLITASLWLFLQKLMSIEKSKQIV